MLFSCQVIHALLCINKLCCIYFNCKVVNHLLKLTGTEHRVASAYHLQTNGLTERFNQTLKGSLIQVVNEKTKLG